MEERGGVEAPKATSYQTVEYLIYFFFGLLGVLLIIRLVLRLTGANISSPFVNLIYGFTGIFTLPFRGIFHQAIIPGIETTAVFEPATLISIIIYAALAFGIVKLVRIISGKKQEAN